MNIRHMLYLIGSHINDGLIITCNTFDIVIIMLDF